MTLAFTEAMPVDAATLSGLGLYPVRQWCFSLTNSNFFV